MSTLPLHPSLTASYSQAFHEYEILLLLASVARWFVKFGRQLESSEQAYINRRFTTALNIPLKSQQTQSSVKIILSF